MGSIRTDGLTKGSGGLRAVREIDLDLPEGGVAGFVGPNGAGKSTTIRMLLGLIRPSSGGGEVLGHPIDRPAAYLHRVGTLIEAPAFHPTLTGEENLQVFARLGGHDRRRIAGLLDVVGQREPPTDVRNHQERVLAVTRPPAQGGRVLDGEEMANRATQASRTEHPRAGGRARRAGRASMLVAVGMLAAVSAAAVPPATPDPPVDTASVDAWVAERMDALGIPGVAVAIVRGGRTIHLQGYGETGPSGEPVSPDTPFLLGSVSKPFTAHVVRRLIDDGLLTLDEPVLPHLAHLVDDPPDGFEAVTVRHLLTHTAGIGMTVGLPGTVPIHTTDDALEHRVRDVLAHPLAATPGERYEYSNAGYALLAATVEQVTGQRFDQALHEQILTPLGMSDTFAHDDDPAAARMATGHRQWFGSWRPADLPFDPAGVAYGYLGSSVADLARFLHAHLDGDPGLVPASADRLADDPVVPTGWDLPLEAGQGLGWMVDDLDGLRTVSHAGSLGHFTAHLIMVPDADRLGLVVVTNASAFIAAGHEAQYDIGIGLTRLLLEQEHTPADGNPLLIYAAPLLLWALVLVAVAAIIRHLVRALSSRSSDRRHIPRSRRFWIGRITAPTLGYLAAAAAVLLTVPLGTARHFYPDVGTALTALTYLALIWGLLRIPLVIATARPRAQAHMPPPHQRTNLAHAPSAPQEAATTHPHEATCASRAARDERATTPTTRNRP
jgi:CubicO group peptidase (beta-lactamase class C family)